jgi:hypothetical protein
VNSGKAKAVDSHQHRHRIATAEIIDAHGEITKLLARLPLPIQIPSLRGTLYRDEVGAGLVRAYTALKDLPMDTHARESLREVIRDWLIAVEWMFRDEEDEAGWHLDVVEVQLSRVLASVDVVEAVLASPTGPE